LGVGPLEITSEEYGYYMDWVDGREDPRLASLDDAGKVKKIAPTLGIKPAELQAIIAKVDPVAKDVGPSAEKAINAALDESPLKGRVLEVHVDAGQGHVVAGVKWRCGDKRDIEKEAAWAGFAVAAGGSVVRTAVVWCVNEIDTTLFSAKASRANLTRINRDQIERFALARYIKLFEDVKTCPHR
jgi:hypothetical protein